MNYLLCKRSENGDRKSRVVFSNSQTQRLNMARGTWGDCSDTQVENVKDGVYVDLIYQMWTLTFLTLLSFPWSMCFSVVTMMVNMLYTLTFTLNTKHCGAEMQFCFQTWVLLPLHLFWMFSQWIICSVKGQNNGDRKCFQTAEHNDFHEDVQTLRLEKFGQNKRSSTTNRFINIWFQIHSQLCPLP